MTEPQFDLDVVLSLFDGISCGQEALKRAGLSTRIFLASEIEKYPKMITRKNHPLTIQLGDVKNVVADDLPHVNLLMGGSPCQGFSFAGKQLNFDDPRSALFFEFVRLLKECKPDYFLLENVKMKQEFQDIISEHLGVEPVMINSALVSAQSRKRLYWTNIPGVTQPKDKGIVLKDILEGDVEVNRNIPDEVIHTEVKKLLKGSKYENNFKWKWDTAGRILVMRPDGMKIQRIGRLAFPDNKTEIVTAVTQPHTTYRKLSVLECSRLQTLPDSYLQDCFDDKGKDISNSQKFKALGNGWTVDVIVHLLQGIKWQS